MTITSNYKTETYDCGDGFLVDIVTANEEYAAWLYHKTYGIKSHMFTMPIKQQSYEKFKEIVERNIVDYISFYAEDYFSDMVV